MEIKDDKPEPIHTPKKKKAGSRWSRRTRKLRLTLTPEENLLRSIFGEPEEDEEKECNPKEPGTITKRAEISEKVSGTAEEFAPQAKTAQPLKPSVLNNGCLKDQAGEVNEIDAMAELRGIDVQVEKMIESLDAMPPTMTVDSGMNVHATFSMENEKQMESVREITPFITPEETDPDLIRFDEETRVISIGSIDYRHICYHLGVSDISEFHQASYLNLPLISLLLIEAIPRYMATKGFKFIGEKNFNRDGDVIPCDKQTWNAREQEFLFTINGFLFFKNLEDPEKNVAFYVYCRIQDNSVGIKCYARGKDVPSATLAEIDSFAKNHNCLRGCRLKDINLMTADFSEIPIGPQYTWEKFYFSQSIIELFQEEILGFLERTKEYNARGLNKRGIMLHGSPGTGKTTAGYVLCNFLPKNTTVIWITPDLIAENNGMMHQSIKNLYKLADYTSPCVVIIEDLDLFSTDREFGGDNLRLGALMNILDGINSIPNAITLATTNRLKVIEDALRNRPGRFDRIIEVPPLEEPLRLRMITDRLHDCVVSQEMIGDIVKRTSGWTGAEIQEFINTMNINFIVGGDTQHEVTAEKVDKAFKRIEEFGVSKNGRESFGFMRG